MIDKQPFFEFVVWGFFPVRYSPRSGLQNNKNAKMHSLKTDSQFDFSNQWVANDLQLNMSKLLNNANPGKKTIFQFFVHHRGHNE